MADLSQADQDAISRAFLEGANTTDTKSAAAFAGDPKQFFCQNWPMIKQGLEAVASLLPVFVRLALTGVIKALDVVHGKIC